MLTLELGLIACLKEFYLQYNKIPPMRVFIKFYNENYATNNQTITSMEIYKLYSAQPMHKLCSMAELPPPSSCI